MKPKEQIFKSEPFQIQNSKGIEHTPSNRIDSVRKRRKGATICFVHTQPHRGLKNECTR